MSKIKKIFAVLLAVALILTAFAGCSKSKDTSAETTTAASSNKKLKIVCTMFPPYDFARAICGDKADIQMLLAPGNEYHSYQASLTDINDIKNSDMFIYVGGESDDWIADVLKQFGNEGPKTCILSELTTAKEENSEGILIPEEEEEEEEPAGEEADVDIDEHVWTSLKMVQEEIDNMCKMICELDSANADYYKANAKSYIAQVAKLDQEFTTMTKAAKTKTIVIADRNPFRYFLEDYNLKAIAAFSGCSSNTEIPLAVQNELIKAVKKNNVKTVFTIELNKNDYADKICKQTGTQKKVLQSCHNVSKEDFENGKTYVDLMQQNYDTLSVVLNE